MLAFYPSINFQKTQSQLHAHNGSHISKIIRNLPNTQLLNSSPKKGDSEEGPLF